LHPARDLECERSERIDLMCMSHTYIVRSGAASIGARPEHP
jgi:hypothetical protein